MPMILNQENIAKYNYETQQARQIKVYNTHGDSIWSSNKEHEIVCIGDRKIRKTVKKTTQRYVNSEMYFTVMNKLEDCLKKLHAEGIHDFDSYKRNISHYPAGAEELFDLLRIDITARMLEEADITPFLAEVDQNDAYTNPFNPQWLYDYVAPFKSFEGIGDRVNLVQIKTGEKDSVYFSFYGVGFEQDLYNQLFNNIFKMEKVTKAVARGYTLRKNDLVMAPILGFDYPALKIINPETAYTYEQNIYDTIQLAIDQLGQLRDYQTGEYIDVTSGLTLICHSTKVRAFNRALTGELRNGSEVKNLSAVREITRIIPYNTKYQYYGNERIEYEGCAVNEAYLCIPRMRNWLALKRDLTHVTGQGDTFGLTSEKEAWYFVPAVYNTQFLGGSGSDPSESSDPTVMTRDMGYIVKITLPELTEPET